VLLVVTLGVLSVGAHFGGTMTRGDSYLSKYAPGPLKALLGAGEAPAKSAAPSKPPSASVDPLLFADVILPILSQRCVQCHGPEKQKGKLRLDSLEYILKGGENGAVVKVGFGSNSPLVQRTCYRSLTTTACPPQGKPTLEPADRALTE
jgi:hypothetical protein